MALRQPSGAGAFKPAAINRGITQTQRPTAAVIAGWLHFLKDKQQIPQDLPQLLFSDRNQSRSFAFLLVFFASACFFCLFLNTPSVTALYSLQPPLPLHFDL